MPEITIDGIRFELRSDEPSDHVNEVAERLRRKLGELRAAQPSISTQKAALLAALVFASEQIKTERKFDSFRARVAGRVRTVLSRLSTDE